MFNETEYRSTVSACRLCVGRAPVFPDPRHGFGSKTPTIMLVGDRPPKAPEDRLYGAWKFHYKNLPKSPDEQRIHDLIVNKFSVTHEDVWSTWAVKCALHYDARPSRDHAIECARRHLVGEIRLLKPTIIVAFGVMACDVIWHTSMTPCDANVTNKAFAIARGIYTLRVVGNMLLLPPDARAYAETEIDAAVDLVRRSTCRMP